MTETQKQIAMAVCKAVGGALIALAAHLSEIDTEDQHADHR